MDTNYSIGRIRINRVRLYVFTGNIPGMGGGSHRMFQGIIQISLRHRLLFGSCCNTFLHSQFPDILISCHYENYPRYTFLWNLTERSCPIGRLFLFDAGKDRGRNRWEKQEGIQSWQTENYRAKLADASFGRQGQAFRFRKKSSSLRSGIFPENLALPEASATKPS